MPQNSGLTHSIARIAYTVWSSWRFHPSYMLRFGLQGSSINCYLDNNNALAPLIKGDINTTIIAAMVATFWRLLRKFSIDIVLGRARSKLSIADRPTRSKADLPYECGSLAEPRELFRIPTAVKRDHGNAFLPSDFVNTPLKNDNSCFLMGI